MVRCTYRVPLICHHFILAVKSSVNLLMKSDLYIRQAVWWCPDS